MKKTIAFMLTLALVLSVCQGALAASFADLAGSNWDWARNTVSELADKGIVKGYSDGTYQPSNVITRQEAFTLFARIVGVNDEVNAKAVEAAQSLYASVAKKYNTYATKELCYMLYRGIFTESDIETYLGESTKNEPLKRHEAAILITKVMGGESALQNTVVYVFDYTDADEIPNASKGYVDFVKKKGIMQGMDDNTFSPNTGVTRAQVAIMLKKTMDTMSMNTVSGTVSNINTSAKTFEISGKSYTMNDYTNINLDGKPVEFSELENGDEAILTIDYKGVWAVDAVSGTAADVQKIEAIYVERMTDTRGSFIRAYERSADASAVKDYQLADNVIYTYNGTISAATDILKNDVVILTLTNGVVTAVDGMSKTITVTDAYVEETVLTPAPALKIAHSDSRYDGKTYEVYSGVYVMRNKKSSSLREILPGDRVTLKIEYDVIISIDATSQLSTDSGTIEEITIGKNASSIKINSGDKTEQYAIVRDTNILVDNKEATIYDLRIGYSVSINVESDTVTRLEVKSVTQEDSITGLVSLINVSLGFVKVDVSNSDGSTTTHQVFIKSGASIIGSSTASRKNISDLQIGDRLMITGKVNMGAFEADTIILFEK